MKKTFKEFTEMNGAYAQLKQINPKIDNTKFGYAWKKFFSKNVEPIFNEYNTCVADTRIDLALTDKVTGEMLIDPMPGRGFKYDKEGMKAVIKAEQKLEKEWEGKEYNVTPYICTAQIPEMNEQQQEIFEGTIIECKPSEKSKK